nr:hypothetical protein [Gluconobacter thailandicus]
MNIKLNNKDDILKFGVSLYSDTSSTADPGNDGLPDDSNGLPDLSGPDNGTTEAPQISFQDADTNEFHMVMAVGIATNPTTYSNRPGTNIPQQVYFDNNLINDSMSYDEYNGISRETVAIDIPIGNYNGYTSEQLTIYGVVQGNTSDFMSGFSSSGEAVQTYSQELASVASNVFHSSYGSLSLEDLSTTIVNSWASLNH